MQLVQQSELFISQSETSQEMHPMLTKKSLTTSVKVGYFNFKFLIFFCIKLMI